MNTVGIEMKTNNLMAMNIEKRDVVAGRLALVSCIGMFVGATGLTLQVDTTSLAFVLLIWLGIVPLVAYIALRQIRKRPGKVVRLLQRIVFGMQALGALVGAIMIVVYAAFGTVMVLTGTIR
jgi:hypothetical protein